MAIVDGYLTLDEIKSFMDLDDTADAADDVHLEIAVEAASRAIDGFCKRTFTRKTQTRHFTPEDSWVLFVGDLVSVTTLKTDADADGVFEDTWVEGTDFLLEPLNAALDGRPFTRVVRHSRGSFVFPRLSRSVEIVGEFGWPAVPAAVKKACAIQAQQFFKRATEAPLGAMDLSFEGGPRIAGPSKFLDREAQLLLQPFRLMLVA